MYFLVYDCSCGISESGAEETLTLRNKEEVMSCSGHYEGNRFPQSLQKDCVFCPHRRGMISILDHLSSKGISKEELEELQLKLTRASLISLDRIMRTA